MRITAEISTTLVMLTQRGAMSEPILACARRVRISEMTIQSTPIRARTMVSTLNGTGMKDSSGR